MSVIPPIVVVERTLAQEGSQADPAGLCRHDVAGSLVDDTDEDEGVAIGGGRTDWGETAAT